MGFWHTQDTWWLESQPKRRWDQTCCNIGYRAYLCKHRRQAAVQALLCEIALHGIQATPDTDATAEMCSSHQVVLIYFVLTYLHTSCLQTDLISYFSTYVGPFDSKFTNYIMLFHQYWLYRDAVLYDNGITLQLRPFKVISGSTALNTISECREPGSACLKSILNFYSLCTKMALDMFSFTSQTRVSSNKHLVHWTSKF